MSVYGIYFSPTGGVKKAIDIIHEAIAIEKEIDLSENTDYSNYYFDENDLCIIAVPCFGGRVAKTAIERLNEMSAHYTKAILVSVYGNRSYDDSLKELYDVSVECGFIPVVAMALVSEHSIVREYGNNRPDEEDRKEILEFLENIKKDLFYKKQIEMKGNKLYIPYVNFPLKPKTKDNCVQCGLCASKCPTSAIDYNDCKEINKTKCISCMRCIEICNHNAKYIPEVMKKSIAVALKPVCTSRKKNEFII